jgi:hypothetical protein
LFQSRNRPTPRPAPPRSSPSIAVGQRVFVNCPEGRSGSVVLVDATGKIFSAVQLADGAEVEIVAWRPRVSGDAHYRVRASSSGADGWLPATNLRKVLVPVAAAEPAVAKANAMTFGGGSGFGGRSPGGRAIAPSSPAPVRQAPAPVVDGRRFGQINEVERAPASSPAPSLPDRPVPGGGRRFGQIN